MLFTVGLQCTNRSTVGSVMHRKQRKELFNFSNVEFEISVKIAQTKQQPIAVV